MSSNSRWASSNLTSSSFSRPPANSGTDDSFLWLSSSVNTEGNSSGPLGEVDGFPPEFGGHTSTGGDSSVRTTFGGKPSRTGYLKMASNTSQPNPASTTKSPPENSSKVPLEASAFRSSWNSTDSGDSGSITQSDFEFLTPSFIAIDDGSGVVNGPAQGRRGGKGGLSVPGSQRVTGDSNTLGQLHYRDRESSILPPASVRSELVGNPSELLDAVVEKVVAPESHDALLPSSTQPLKISRKPSHQAQDIYVTQAPPRPLPQPKRYYHQPPPRQEKQVDLRHAPSTSSQDTIINKSSRGPLPTQPKPDPTIASLTYPPTSFSNIKSKTTNSKAGDPSYSPESGVSYIASASVSPTSATAFLGDPSHSPLISPSTVSSNAYPTSMTGLLSGRNRGNSASEGAPVKHPYASSSAYRMAVTNYDGEKNLDRNTGAGYVASNLDHHPFAQYQQVEYRESSHAQSNAVGGASYSPNLNPPSSLPSKTSSNVGHGATDISEIQRDSGRRSDREKSDHEQQEWTLPTGRLARPAKDGGAGKTKKKEKRQSAATLLSLRIRNVYPVPSSSERSSGTRFNTTYSQSSANPTNSGDVDKFGFHNPTSAAENIDLWILKWCGIISGTILLIAIVPALGTAYSAVGHAILRAKAESDAAASSSSSNSASSVFIRASITSSAKAGALGGAILSLPVLLLVFIAVGPAGLVDLKNTIQKALSPSNTGNDDDQNTRSEKQQQLAAVERRRSRRASSLWGPTAASVSFKEQTTAELALNVTINIFLAILFLCLGAASAALGATILAPSSHSTDTNGSAFLSVSTAALAGLVGGAILFGGAIIIGGIMGWLLFEASKPIPLADQQVGFGSVSAQGVGTGEAAATNGGSDSNAATGKFSRKRSGSSFGGGQQPTTASTGNPRWI